MRLRFQQFKTDINELIEANWLIVAWISFDWTLKVYQIEKENELK